MDSRLLTLAFLALLANTPMAEAQEGPPSYPGHAKLMVVRDREGAEVPVRSPADWQVRKAHILANLQEVTGPLPGGERRVPLDVKVVEEVDQPDHRRIKLSYASEPGDRVTAWLLIPKGEVAGPRPAMLCLHQTTNGGKDEPVGLGGKPNLAYAKELVGRGYVCLAPDYPNFGERKLDVYTLGYASATMKGIWDHMRGVDLLSSRPEVDPERIGVIGHSLGGHNAVFVALFDDRLKVVVSSCGFNAFPRYYGGNIAGWSHGGYMPRLRSKYELDLSRVPFDWPELIGALAPRPFFTNSPVRDENFEVGGVRECIEAAKPVYELLGAGGDLVAEYPEAEHDFPTPTRMRAYEFIDGHLGTGRAH